MRIFIVSRGYPNLKYSMNGVFEFDQAMALKKEGFDVVYLAADVRSLRRWRKWGLEKMTLHDVPVIAYNLPIGRVPEIFRVTAWRIMIRRLLKKAKKYYGEPDIIHTHFYNMGYACAKIKTIFKAPLVITEHSSKMATKLDKETKAMARYAYSKADGIICVSSTLQSFVNKTFSVNAICIPNIVDTSVFTACQHKKEDSSFRFISTGSLLPRKGHEATIRAFADAFKNISTVSLTIFGAGPDHSRLIKLIDSYNLTDQIKLMGLQTRERIAEEMKKSDCFILASKGETFGVAYIEATASGLPVIATKCKGPEDFITEENGLLVDIGNHKQLVDAMVYMTNNTQKYDPINISQKTKTMFSRHVVANQIIEYYRQIIQKQHLQ